MYTHTNKAEGMMDDSIVYKLYDIHHIIYATEKKKIKYLGINLIRNSQNLRRKTIKVYRTN